MISATSIFHRFATAVHTFISTLCLSLSHSLSLSNNTLCSTDVHNNKATDTNWRLYRRISRFKCCFNGFCATGSRRNRKTASRKTNIYYFRIAKRSSTHCRPSRTSGWNTFARISNTTHVHCRKYSFSSAYLYTGSSGKTYFLIWVAKYLCLHNDTPFDEATAHTARPSSMAAIRQFFGNRVISRFGDIHWPQRSPDLTVCDFFLWRRYVKNRVCNTQIQRELLRFPKRCWKERLAQCQRSISGMYTYKWTSSNGH